MIVRNEAETLPRLAESLEGSIDSWLIVDNGPSTDDTERVAKECFGHLPGQFRQSELPVFDFAAARNEAIALAEEPGVYLLMMDADSPLHGKIDGSTLTEDVYLLSVTEGACEWRIPILWKSDIGARYVGKAHEYLRVPDDAGYEHYKGAVILRYGHGANRERMLWYIDVLSEDADEPRNAFYLANTYRDLYYETREPQWRDKAIDAYVHRAEVEQHSEETFMAIYRLGELYEDTDPQKALLVYLEAAGFRPTRAEPWFKLAKCCNALGEYRSALAFAQKGMGLPPTDDWIFVERWIEKWGLRFEAAVAMSNLGRKQEALAEFRELEKRTDLTPLYRPLLTHNLNVMTRPVSNNRAKSKKRRK